MNCWRLAPGLSAPASMRSRMSRGYADRYQTKRAVVRGLPARLAVIFRDVHKCSVPISPDETLPCQRLISLHNSALTSERFTPNCTINEQVVQRGMNNLQAKYCIKRASASLTRKRSEVRVFSSPPKPLKRRLADAGKSPDNLVGRFSQERKYLLNVSPKTLYLWQDTDFKLKPLKDGQTIIPTLSREQLARIINWKPVKRGSCEFTPSS